MTANKLRKLLISVTLMLTLQACGGKETAYNPSKQGDQQAQQTPQIQEMSLDDEFTFNFLRGQDLFAEIPLKEALLSDISAEYEITKIQAKDRGTFSAYGMNHLVVGKKFDMTGRAGTSKLNLSIAVNKMLPVPGKCTVLFELKSDSPGMPKTLTFIVEPQADDIVKVGTVISHTIGIEGDARISAHYIPARAYNGQVYNIPTNSDKAIAQNSGVENFNTTARLWRVKLRKDGVRVAQYFDFNGRWQKAYPLKNNRKTSHIVGTGQVMAATIRGGQKLYYGRAATSKLNVPIIGSHIYPSPVGEIKRIAIPQRAHKIIYMVDKAEGNLHRVIAAVDAGKMELKVTKTFAHKKIVGLHGGVQHVAAVTANKRIHVYSTRVGEGLNKVMTVDFASMVNPTDQVVAVSGRYNRMNVRMKSGHTHTWVIQYSEREEEWKSFKVDNVTYTDDILVGQTREEALVVDPIEKVAYRILNPALESE